MYNFFNTMVRYGEKIILNMKEFYQTLTMPMTDFVFISDIGIDEFAQFAWGLPPDGTLLDLIIMGSITVIIVKTLISWILSAIPFV